MKEFDYNFPHLNDFVELLIEALGEKGLAKVGEERFNNFIEQYKGHYEKTIDIKSHGRNSHVLPEDLKEYSFQKDFRDLMGVAHGEFAKEILEERPNLTLRNISNFFAFDEGIYRTFGKNFVNHLLNFDYSRITDEHGNTDQFKELMSSITKDEEMLQSFKFCYDLVSSEGNEQLYDYTKLFNVYNKHRNLINDCYKHKSEMSQEDLNNLLNYFAVKESMVLEDKEKLREIRRGDEDIKLFEIHSFEELKQYHSKSREYFNFMANDYPTYYNVMNAICYRFLGLTGVTNKPNGQYTKSMTSLWRIAEMYNVKALIQYEEHCNDFGGKKYLDNSEVALLKIINAFSTVLEKATSNYSQDAAIDVLLKFYNALDKESVEKPQGVVMPSDVLDIIEKLPKIYENALKQTLSSVDDLESAVQRNDNGISKEFIERKVGNETIKIPVYHLKGVDFSLLTTALETGFTPHYQTERSSIAGVQDLVDKFFNFENGTTHVSLSYVDSMSQKALEFFNQGEEKINIVMPKDISLISMGLQDLFSPEIEKIPDIYSSENTKFYLPFQFAELNKPKYNNDIDTYEKQYNEIVVERYKMEGPYSGRTPPEAILKRGTTPHERVVEYAAQMTAYLREHNLVPFDYVLPIIMVEKEKYLDFDESEKSIEIMKKHLLLSELVEKSEEGGFEKALHMLDDMAESKMETLDEEIEKSVDIKEQETEGLEDKGSEIDLSADVDKSEGSYTGDAM